MQMKYQQVKCFDIMRRQNLKRSEKEFPIKDDVILVEFLHHMWEKGWLDDFSDEHFLLRIMENRLTDFIGEQQAYLDNTLMYPCRRIKQLGVNLYKKCGGLWILRDKKIER